MPNTDVRSLANHAPLPIVSGPGSSLQSEQIDGRPLMVVTLGGLHRGRNLADSG